MLDLGLSLGSKKYSIFTFPFVLCVSLHFLLLLGLHNSSKCVWWKRLVKGWICYILFHVPRADLHLLRNEATAMYCGGSSLRGLLWNVGPFSNVALFNTEKLAWLCIMHKSSQCSNKNHGEFWAGHFPSTQGRFEIYTRWKKTEWVQNDAERCCIKRWFFLIYKHPIRLAITVSWYEIFILQLTYAKSQQVFFSKSSTRISRFMGHKKHNCNLNIF